MVQADQSGKCLFCFCVSLMLWLISLSVSCMDLMGRPLPSNSKLAPVTQLMLGVDGGGRGWQAKIISSENKPAKRLDSIPKSAGFAHLPPPIKELTLMRCKQGDTLLLLAGVLTARAYK